VADRALLPNISGGTSYLPLPNTRCRSPAGRSPQPRSPSWCHPCAVPQEPQGPVEEPLPQPSDSPRLHAGDRAGACPLPQTPRSRGAASEPAEPAPRGPPAKPGCAGQQQGEGWDPRVGTPTLPGGGPRAHPSLGISRTSHSPPGTGHPAPDSETSRHKPLCGRLHQPCLEKSLNPPGRASGNPSGAAGLPVLPNPLPWGWARLGTRCRDGPGLPAAGCSLVLQLGMAGAAGPVPHQDMAASLSRAVGPRTAVLSQLWSIGLTAIPTGDAGQGWERGPRPRRQRGEPTSVPPAARLGFALCRGRRLERGRVARGRQWRQHNPTSTSLPAGLPPRRGLCPASRAPGLRQGCRSRCPRSTDSGEDLEAAVLLAL